MGPGEALEQEHLLGRTELSLRVYADQQVPNILSGQACWLRLCSGRVPIRRSLESRSLCSVAAAKLGHSRQARIAEQDAAWGDSCKLCYQFQVYSQSGKITRPFKLLWQKRPLSRETLIDTSILMVEHIS